MGKHRKANVKHTDLGRNLIKKKNIERRQAGRSTKNKDSWLHTTDLNDGHDYSTINLKSITEQSTLDEFLETAELAGVEFTAERRNIKVVGTGSITGVLGEVDKARVRQLHEEKREYVTIPRRPPWDDKTSPEQLKLSERDIFLNWRRSLALLQEENDLLLTPYEKNLDVWRQLWRVMERSDLICQIVDARNPLLYKCDDLENYANELNKEFIVLINKADYLSENQRLYWADYFTSTNTKIVFWSALDETIKNEENDKTEEEDLTESAQNMTLRDSDSDDDDDDDDDDKEVDENKPKIENTTEKSAEIKIEESINISKATENDDGDDDDDSTQNGHINTTVMLSQCELIEFFKKFEKVDKDDGKHLTIGLVGYPNVGKSSTINALMQDKKTAVSATPGKTKHFQTLFYDDELCLCDCPGLVFPTFIATKAEMVLNGVLPIDQLKDHRAPSNLYAELIPRKIIENTYGINIPQPKEGENPDRAPTSDEVLSSYAKMRGYMTAHGLPDCPRASRYVLKDFIKGKVLYCFPPPGVSEEEYEPCTMTEKVLERTIAREEKIQKQVDQGILPKVQTSSVDKDFFTEKTPQVYFKVPSGSTQQQHQLVGPDQYVVHKPWKKHGNRNKKEKLRRLYTDDS